MAEIRVDVEVDSLGSLLTGLNYCSRRRSEAEVVLFNVIRRDAGLDAALPTLPTVADFVAAAFVVRFDTTLSLRAAMG